MGGFPIHSEASPELAVCEGVLLQDLLHRLATLNDMALIRSIGGESIYAATDEARPACDLFYIFRPQNSMVYSKERFVARCDPERIVAILKL